MITRFPRTCCPHCDSELDAAAPEALDNESIPEPGDVSICLYCAELAVYTEQMSLRRITAEDIEDMPPDFIQQLGETQERIRNRPMCSR